MAGHALLSETEPSSIDLMRMVEACPPAGIVSRTLLQAPGVRVVLLAFAEGQELSEHSSPRRALVQVVTGQCEFQFGGAWHALDGGALVHLPPNHPHALRTAGGCMILLTLTSSSGNPEPNSG